jgi:hypothetical protein
MCPSISNGISVGLKFIDELILENNTTLSSILRECSSNRECIGGVGSLNNTISSFIQEKREVLDEWFHKYLSVPPTTKTTPFNSNQLNDLTRIYEIIMHTLLSHQELMNAVLLDLCSISSETHTCPSIRRSFFSKPPCTTSLRYLGEEMEKLIEVAKDDIHLCNRMTEFIKLNKKCATTEYSLCEVESPKPSAHRLTIEKKPHSFHAFTAERKKKKKKKSSWISRMLN